MSLKCADFLKKAQAKKVYFAMLGKGASWKFYIEAEAKSLATSLKFGALPISFERNPTVETVGPSLAGDQLSAGITAGIVGLLLVMVYCLFYYRGLGIVVIASLLVAERTRNVRASLALA